MKKLAIVILTLLALPSCKTVQPVYRVEENRKEVTVYSSRSRGASLQRSSESRKIFQLAGNLERQLQSDPKNSTVMLDLANVYMMRNDYNKARTLVSKALNYDLHSRRAAKLLAELEIEANNFKKAELILARLQKTEAKDADIMNLMGLMSLKRRNVPEAVIAFNDGLKVDPTNVAIRMNLGSLFMEYRRFDVAEQQFREVLRMVPNHTDAKLNYAVIATLKNNDELAEKLYQQVIQEDRDNAFALFNYALLTYRNSNFEKSLELVRGALSLGELRNEERVKAENLRDDVLAEMKRLEEQRKAARKEAKHG